MRGLILDLKTLFEISDKSSLNAVKIAEDDDIHPLAEAFDELILNSYCLFVNMPRLFSCARCLDKIFNHPSVIYSAFADI